MSKTLDNAEVMAKRDLSFAPVINPSPRHLTPDQIAAYNEQGFIHPLPVFDEAEVRANRAYFDRIMAEIEAANDGRDSYSINGYQLNCRRLYDMAIHPRILD